MELGSPLVSTLEAPCFLYVSSIQHDGQGLFIFLNIQISLTHASAAHLTKPKQTIDGVKRNRL